MNSPRIYSAVILATLAAPFAVTLAACGSGTDTASTSTSSATEKLAPSTTEIASPASTCPSAAPNKPTQPEWALPGATGSVAVTGSTDTAAPYVHVDTPFTTTATQVHTLHVGDGPVVADTATVSVCYMGVNGRDGSVFDSSYERGEPVEFPLNRVVPGFQKAIAGQQVGSTVAVAMTSADGYPQGQPAAGIQPGDTLVFAIKILSSSS
ncbi:MAG: FKBP-type peptidyl-prolyl cis-trans isomerase [Terrimesophilobacter sp.]